MKNRALVLTILFAFGSIAQGNDRPQRGVETGHFRKLTTQDSCRVEISEFDGKSVTLNFVGIGITGRECGFGEPKTFPCIGTRYCGPVDGGRYVRMGYQHDSFYYGYRRGEDPNGGLYWKYKELE